MEAVILLALLTCALIGRLAWLEARQDRAFWNAYGQQRPLRRPKTD